MSFPLYKDVDKAPRDLLKDDFDTKYSLKVKSEAPHGVSLTTTTDYNPAASVLPTKINLKWAHESGFAVDKFEIASADKITLETSLTGVAPGLKFEFKGVDAATGTLGVIYKHKYATLASELDIAGFSTFKSSVLGGSNGVSVGASADFSLSDKFDVKDFSAAVAYTPCAGVFAGVKANKKFTEFNGAVGYKVKPNLSLAALIDVPKKSAYKFNIGASYKCQPETTVKVKVDNDGVIRTSVKQDLPKKLTLVGAAEVDVKNISQFNFGVTATLG